uniref:Uncharacterized protein n=1 Tax=Caenorhabditis japonica TaxID=281687 RepID=A0A8R1I102_CAEJA
MLKYFIIASAFLNVATCIQCHSCDSFLNCNNPFPVFCPENSKCYTLLKGETIIAKGCAHSCDSLERHGGTHCSTCHHRDFCNGYELGIGQGVVLKHSPPVIGEGINPANDYHIGHGVRPRSASTMPLLILMVLPLVRSFLC